LSTDIPVFEFDKASLDVQYMAYGIKAVIALGHSDFLLDICEPGIANSRAMVNRDLGWQPNDGVLGAFCIRARQGVRFKGVAILKKSRHV
jgi:hypothetical protein